MLRFLNIRMAPCALATFVALCAPPCFPTICTAEDGSGAYDDVSSSPFSIVDSEELYQIPRSAQAPDATIDELAASSNDWFEPSPKSEIRYVGAIRQWLDTLSPSQQEKARKILKEARPRTYALRVAIRDKKKELQTLNFNANMRPDALPRLGQELNDLRGALRAELQQVGDRLLHEAGVGMGPLGGDGFWLAPPDAPQSPQARDSSVPGA